MYDERQWGRYFADQDHPDPRPLASGTEGAVWLLGDGLAGKVWFHRSTAELLRLGAFLDDVAYAGLPMAAPRFLDVRTGPDGALWTLEPELPGRPLAVDTAGRSPELTVPFVEALLEVHGALAEVTPSPGLRLLPALGEDQPLLAGRQSFPSALAGLVERRVAGSRPVLEPTVPDLGPVAEAVAAALRDIDDSPEALVHGDLYPANILVDEGLRPTAVLDFGLLSTVGDPAFDAAVTAGVTDLYGPRSAATREVLDAAMTERFGYAPERLALYRLGYALATAAWFDPAGADGHTGWCRGILGGRDAALALT